MALAIDAVSTGSQNTGASFTWNHTCSGSDRLLIVDVSVPADVDVTVTYNGVSMTLVDSANNASAARIFLFRLINPASGTNAVVVTPNHSGVAAARARSFTGANQTTPLGTAATATGNSSTPSVTVSSASSDIVIDAVGYTELGQTYTPGSGQTEDTFVQNSEFTIKLRGSHETASGASTVMDWSTTSAHQWTSIGVAVKPAGTAQTFSHTASGGMTTGGAAALKKIKSYVPAVPSVALVIDAVSTGSQNTGASFTWNHTCSGSDRVLYVFVSTVADVFPTATYNGVSMTNIGFSQNAAAGRMTLFRLINPSIGANSVVVSGMDNQAGAARAISFTGAHQTTPDGTVATANGNSNSPSVTVSSASGDIVIDAVSYIAAGQEYTPGSGQTADTFVSNSNDEVRNRGSHETASGASTIMDWSTTSAHQWGSIGVAVKPVEVSISAGGVSVGGAAETFQSGVFLASGGMTLSGVAGLKKVKTMTASGLLTTDGAALTVKTGGNIQQHTGSGQLLLGGAAAFKTVKKYVVQFVGEITLAWDASSGATGYKLYYDTDSGEPYIGTGALEGASPIDVGNVTQFTLHNLQQNTVYYFAVKAYNASGESAFSNEFSDLILSGVFRFSAGASFKLIKQFLSSGSALMAGAALLKKIIKMISSGGLVTSGAALTQKLGGTSTFIHTATGVLLISGAANLKLLKAFLSQAAPLVFQGNADLKKALAFTGSGTLAISGQGSLKKTKTHTTSGGVVTTGTAVIVLVGQGLFIYAGSGGLITSGGASLKLLKTLLGSGGLSIDGFASFKNTVITSISGGVVLFGGSSSEVLIKSLKASGGLITSGAANTELVLIGPGKFVYIPSGPGVVISGAGLYKLSKKHVPTGGVTITGAALLIIPSVGILSTITVFELMSEIATMVLEDSNFTCSTLWSVTEIIDYINDAQKEFVLRGQMLKRVDPLGVIPTQRVYSEPPQTMQIDRITFDSVPLYRTSSDLLDLEDRNWRTKSGVPKKYHQDHLPKKNFELDRSPTSAMSNSVLETVGTILPVDVGAINDRLGVPDYCGMYVKFGVLARMLSKQGEAQDLVRAAYCQQRLEFGAELFGRLITGMEI